MAEALHLDDAVETAGFHSSAPPSARDRKRDILELLLLEDVVDLDAVTL